VIALLAVAVTGAWIAQPPAQAARPAPKHHRKPKRCKHGSVRIRRKGANRVKCVKAGKPPHLAAPVAGVREMRAMIGGVPLRVRRHRHLRHRPKTLGKLLAAHHVKPAVVERVLGKTASRLPVGLAHASGVFAGPSVDGWSTSVDTGDGSGEVTVTAKKQGVKMSMTYGDEVAIDACPDADGDLGGHRTLVFGFHIDGKDEDGRRIKIAIDAKATARFTAHIGDDVKVRDFDVDPFTMYVYVRGEAYDASGKLVLSTPPYLPNVKGSVHGLQLGHIDADDLNRAGGGVAGTAPKEMGTAGVQSFLKWSLFEFDRSVDEANDKLTDAQSRGWQHCLDVSVTAAKTTLEPGESTTLTVTVAPHGGGGLAPARLTSSSLFGSLAPAETTTSSGPIQFTFTAPGSGWDGTDARFTAASRQGHGFGAVSLQAAPPRTYVLVFSHDSQVDDTHTVDNPSFQGTVTHHEAYGLGARIPLSGDPTAGTVTGAGPISYTRAEYRYWQDGTFHGQGTCSGSDHTDLTATQGGTARVLGVRLSGGSVTLDFAPGAYSSAGNGPPSETYRNVQTYDVCPGADNTDQQALFLNRFANEYDSSGWVFGPDPHVHLADGWVQGSGDVVATLDITDSGYHDHYEIDRLR
jgi:hypothetical protein